METEKYSIESFSKRMDVVDVNEKIKTKAPENSP